jgi:salicylate hydroxylase
MAQGAAQATEDAACLAACLEHFSSLEASLSQYQRQRLPRTTYIARNTRVLQDWWHVPDGSLKDQRDESMKLADNRNPMFWGSPSRLDWLFGHDASKILHGDAVAEGVPALPPQVSPEESVYRELRAKKAAAVNGQYP